MQRTIHRVIVAALIIGAVSRADAQQTFGRSPAEQALLDYVGGGIVLPVPFPRSLAPARVRDDPTKKEADWFAAWAEENAPMCPARPLADTSTWVPATNRGTPLPFRIPAALEQDLAFGNLRIGAQWKGRGSSVTLDHYPLDGTYNPISFGSGRLVACRVRGIASDFLIQPAIAATGYSVMVTPVGATDTMATRIYGGARTIAQLDMIWTVAAMMTRAPYGQFTPPTVATGIRALVVPGLPPGRAPEQIVRDLVGGGVTVPTPFPLTLPPNPTWLDSTRAQNTQPSLWIGKNAPPCPPPPMADTAQLLASTKASGNVLGNVIDAPSVNRYGVRLPPGFVQDTDFRSFHGGARWVGPGGATIALENGWWAASSGSGRALSCRFEGARGSYLVSIGATPEGYSIFAYLAQAVGGSSLSISGTARTVEGLGVIWTAIRDTPK